MIGRTDVEQIRQKPLPSRMWSLFLLLVAAFYFVMPLDLLPDPIYLDEVVALVAALGKVYFTFRQHSLARQAVELEPVKN